MHQGSLTTQTNERLCITAQLSLPVWWCRSSPWFYYLACMQCIIRCVFVDAVPRQRHSINTIIPKSHLCSYFFTFHPIRAKICRNVIPWKWHQILLLNHLIFPVLYLFILIFRTYSLYWVSWWWSKSMWGKQDTVLYYLSSRSSRWPPFIAAYRQLMHRDCGRSWASGVDR